MLNSFEFIPIVKDEPPDFVDQLAVEGNLIMLESCLRVLGSLCLAADQGCQAVDIRLQCEKGSRSSASGHRSNNVLYKYSQSFQVGPGIHSELLAINRPILYQIQGLGADLQDGEFE